jgi:haloacetate dehalogenase
MFEGFEEFNVPVASEVTLHGRKGGTGPPLLLLHGYPQNHRIWHIVAPQLTSSFTVVIPDLRGYGKSSTPPSDDSHSVYSKRSTANDMVALMKHFGFSKFNICGHDRGGRVGHRLAVDYPDVVTKLMVLDIAPTLAMYEATNFRFASAYWHWFFLIQPYPLPETLITAKPDMIMRGLGKRAGFEFHPDAARSYEEGLGNWDVCHAMCEDYRAAATIDMEQAKEDIQKGRKVQCPLRCVWGKQGVIELMFKPLALWREVCEGPVDGSQADCGHFIPEQAPDETVKQIKQFFA